MGTEGSSSVFFLISFTQLPVIRGCLIVGSIHPLPSLLYAFSVQFTKMFWENNREPAILEEIKMTNRGREDNETSGGVIELG